MPPGKLLGHAAEVICGQCGRHRSLSGTNCPYCGVPIEARRIGGFEWTSERRLWGRPLVHICWTADASGVGKRARGIIAVGAMAQGIVAVGFNAVGLLAIGAVSAGVISIGCLAMGLISVGFTACGVVAAGYNAFGLVAFGSNGFGCRINGEPPAGWRSFHPPR